jgi:RHS repeat-associated protein
VFVSDAQLSDVHGRWRTESVGGADAGWSSRSYAYDGASRLVGVKESRTAGGCLSRVYGWDLNGNRTSASTYPADAAGACSTTTTAIRSTAPVFDAADRMIASGVAAGTAYDAWGRITTLPAGLTSTPVAGDAGASYYANDLVRSVSQLVLDAEGAPTTTSGVRTWTLDPAGRLATMTSTGLGATALSNHYSDPTGDSPTWTADTAADGTVTTRRYLSGPAGYLGEATTTAGSTTTSIGLAGLHGDILRTTTPTASGSPDGPALDVDEFGLITNPDTATTGTGPRYGWLGTHQRATDTGSAGLTLMGVRLYAPVLGRFLTTDPIYGGNATTYGYPTNPVAFADYDGRATTPIGTYDEPFWLDAQRLPGEHRIEGVYFDRFGRQIPLRRGRWGMNPRKGEFTGWGLSKLKAKGRWNVWMEDLIQLTLVIGKVERVGKSQREIWTLSLPCDIPGGQRLFVVIVDLRREADGLRRGIANAYVRTD